jgi:hypothetical protein
MKAYFIRSVKSPAYHISAWEGEDGKARAEELVEIHNRFFPNDKWTVTEETV